MKNEKNNNSGRSFASHATAVQKALNEKTKNSGDKNARQSNRKENRTRSTDVSEKKVGSGKQKSPGD